MNPYIGHTTQISGVEEHRLVGGKGDGQRIYEISNGKGMELTVSPDRNNDITRLRFKGVNMSYLSPSGYVAPAYYDKEGTEWLRSFTAGFLTTCGLQSVGVACEEEGESYPFHGSVANLPCEYSYWEEDEKRIRLFSVTRDEVMFGRKLELKREIEISKTDASFTVTDEISNTGDRTEGVEVLYHMNMGYPLLDEDSVVEIPSAEVIPRDECAASDLENWMKMEKPQAGFQEKCYYHKFRDGLGRASIFQPKEGVGLEITFDSSELDGFVEWKMMGVRDYVLGLECGNCLPDGRVEMQKKGMLKFLQPGETKVYRVCVKLSTETSRAD